MIYIIRPYASLPSDGAGNDRYVSLCLELKSRGVDVSLLCSNFVHNKKIKRSSEQMCSNKDALPFVIELDSFEYKKNTSARRVLHELFFGIKALSLAVRTQPKSILVGEPLFFVGWMFVLYGLISGTKVNADVIDAWPEADTRTPKGAKGAALKVLYAVLKFSRSIRFRLYSKISFVSKSYASMFSQSNDKSAVFYWGSNLLPDICPVKARDKITIVYAGSFGEGYDIKAILDAAKLATSHGNGKLSFIVAGGGQQEALVKDSANNGHIDYVGYANKEQLMDMYMKADIGLLPYKSGSMVAMPIKFFDYVNFGIYTISSLNLEVRDVIRSNNIGRTYKAGDSHDLYEKILEAAGAPSILGDTAMACEQLSAFYSIERQYSDFADFITDDHLTEVVKC